MNREMIIERQGKAYVLYGGLLDLAHAAGLTSIRTELIQTPCEGNQNVAICAATVVLTADGAERIYTGLGDAAPGNVAAAMKTCLIRMAETRAKARALRDAVNIGVAVFEEFGELELEQSQPVATPARGTRRGSLTLETSGVAPRRQRAVIDPDAAATPAQCNAISSLSAKQGLDATAKAKELFGKPAITELTQREAGALIGSLNERPPLKLRKAA
ncbi:MAG: hypothetical protein KGJ62_12525 [Armatimonadetes bacterium]|nr:hypothetical protein [Armatimonadota bacterium]MDE2206915.1 hypothetical protein [Armatimonadota bacterium]